MSGEFDIIARHFAPLATDPGAFGLTDDAALLGASAYVVTKDLLVEGVHFLSRDSRDLVARKCLRVNLSDLAAKGARPVGYFLGCVWPAGVKEAAVADFARGLGEDQETFRIALLGGDTTVHVVKGAPLTVSITMLGYPSASGIIRRNGAAAGDDLYVTGAIGDAGLGLRAIEGAIKPAAAAKKYLTDRYRLPAPRLSIGGALAGLATSAIDISDGLLADAGHLARQSGVAIEIAADKIPLSEAAAALVGESGEGSSAIADLASCGDDYEILFTAPPSRRRSIEMASQVTKTPVARIGAVSRGAGVRLIGENGKAIDTPQRGFDHFSR